MNSAHQLTQCCPGDGVRRVICALADNGLLLAIDIDQRGCDTRCRGGRPDLDFTTEGALYLTSGSAANTCY